MGLRGFILVALCAASLSAHAYFQVDMLRNKNQSKAPATRWTLADWLAQKNKNRLADQWLAAHSSKTIFEADVSGAYQAYTLKSDAGSGPVNTNQTGQIYTGGFSVSIVEFAGEYRKTNDAQESYSGGAGLRVLGATAQSTSLTVRYGWEHLSHLSTQEHWDRPFVEAALQLYVVSSFGLMGEYRNAFSATSNLGQRLLGHRVKAGAFLEFGEIRIFADYFQEPLRFATDSATTQTEDDGFEGGLRLFF